MSGIVHSRAVDVLVIGGGPAGLTAAAALSGHDRRRVLVVERESSAGGIPRHSDHQGFGLRDLHRPLRGPPYARRLVGSAVAAGAEIATGTTVTDWDGDHAVFATSAAGRMRIEARAVVLATGARERPRAARRIAGDRPAGVVTTGQLQQLVHLGHRRVGTRAVVVGAEAVSWSAVLTLRAAGCATALMTTTYPSPEVYAALSWLGRGLLGTPVACRTRVARVIGHGRVSAVELEHLDTGAREVVRCDTLVLTGDWIPDHELVRTGGLELDRATRGPLVDGALGTSRPGVFAAGNLVHPVDTADVAALDGRHVAGQVVAFLDGGATTGPGLRLMAAPPLTWVTPGVVRPGGPSPPRGRLLAWTDRYVAMPRVVVTQDRRSTGSRRLPWPAAPGRVFRIPSGVLDRIDPAGGPVTITARR